MIRIIVCLSALEMPTVVGPRRKLGTVLERGESKSNLHLFFVSIYGSWRGEGGKNVKKNTLQLPVIVPQSLFRKLNSTVTSFFWAGWTPRLAKRALQ